MRSKRRTIAWITTAVTVAVLATLLWTTGSVQAGPLAQVPLRITYQGRLTDSGGSPLTGNYDFYFGIYSAQSGGTLLWSETQSNVSVDKGTFTVQLGAVTALNPAHFDGSIRWLEVRVRQAGTGSFTTLTPRQQLVSVPYVLASGNHCGQTWSCSGTNLTLRNGTTGLDSSGSTFGVYGSASGTSGSGVYGQAPLYGVYGYATGYGSADWGAFGDGGSQAGGVIGVSTGSAIFAVRGSNSNGLGGYFWNNNSSYYALEAYNASGSTSPGLYVRGTSYFTGSKTGYVVDVCLNEGEEALEPGDVVVITGYAPPLLGEIPVIKVRKSSKAYDTGVAGVVDTRQAVAAEGLSDTAAADPKANSAAPAGIHFVEGAVEQSDYLLVVTLGAFKAIKVDASYGAIQPGDLLATSPNPGHAMKATEPRFGTIIGKALGSLDSGTGIIPVFVTLH